MGCKLKVSNEERIKAVQKYINNQDSMNHIAFSISVTYHAFEQWVNIYQSLGAEALKPSTKTKLIRGDLKNKQFWIIKYNSGGVEALQDRRGKRKSENEMSELEKLRAKNTLFEAENRRQQMEIVFLKNLRKSKGGGFKPSKKRIYLLCVTRVT